jgi:hypothetical protein
MKFDKIMSPPRTSSRLNYEGSLISREGGNIFDKFG